MITYINATNLEFSNIRNEMYRMRAEIFHHKLGWEVAVNDGMEIDLYDSPELNPTYLLQLCDRSHRLQASMRLLPTMGPHMMQGPFKKLFPIELDMRHPNIWESTRFTTQFSSGQNNGRLVRRSTVELIMGLCSLAIDSGVTHITGVFESPMATVYKRLGWEPHLLCKSTPETSTLPVSVGLWEANSATLERLIELHGFEPNFGNLQPNDTQIAA